MAKFSSIYKQTAPTRRTVNGENTYEKGMLWSNQALMPGYTHTLLNLEIDSLSGTLIVPGGFHTTDAAAGSSFIDYRITNSDQNLLIFQNRNEYCLRAFEGITNILSIQKLAIKNNLNLLEKIKQQGFSGQDTVCYKILTYNVINHKLMEITLLKTDKDKYFTLDDNITLHRLNANPISCGFSEIWDSSNMQLYNTPLDIVGSSSSWSKCVYNNTLGLFVRIAFYRAIYSTDGINWSISPTTLPNNTWADIIVTSFGFIAIPYSGNIGIKTTDGINWETITLNSTVSRHIIEAYDKNNNYSPYLLITNYNTNTGSISTDYGSTWTDITIPIAQPTIVKYVIGGKVILLNSTTTAYYSEDKGATWTSFTLPVAGNWQGMSSYGTPQGYILFSNTPDINLLKSTDGINWSIIAHNLTTTSSDIIYNNSLKYYILLGNDYIAYSYNAINWIYVALIQHAYWKYILFANNKFYIYNLQSRIITFNNPDLYISNKLDYHTNGAQDNYIPRTRRNKLNNTFNQKLYSPHRMQTIAHTEGYSNKTFMFTKKKQVDLEGDVVNQSSITSLEVYSILDFNTANPIYKNFVGYSVPAAWPGNYNYAVGDIIEIYPTTASDIIEKFKIKVTAITTVTHYSSEGVSYGTTLGVISAYDILSHGLFKWSDNGPHTHWTYTNIVGSGYISIYEITRYKRKEIPDPSIAKTTNFQYDTYFGNMHTGSLVKLDETIDNKHVPLDAYRFGTVLTSLYLRTSVSALNNSVEAMPASFTASSGLWSTDMVEAIKRCGSTGLTNSEDSYNDSYLIQLNLNTGEIKPVNANILTEDSYLTVEKLPLFDRASGTNDTPLLNIFQNDGSSVKIENWFPTKGWYNLPDLLLDSVSKLKRVGQGIRIAAFCQVAVPLNRALNTLSLNSTSTEKYYKAGTVGLFILDYVWNGNRWDFSFVDAEEVPTDTYPTLTENWNIEGQDTLNNYVCRHYVWKNCLSYTDIITDTNIDDLAEHIIDYFQGPKSIVVYQNSTKAYDKTITKMSSTLAVKLEETIDDYFDNSGSASQAMDPFIRIDNNSKTANASFGHFEVEPRSLTPAEAARWGYNMLSPTPYTFDCSDTPLVEPTLLGVLLMKNGIPLLYPTINTPASLYVYFSADFDAFATAPEGDGGYQLILEYKNIYDNWRILKEFSTTETHELFNAGKYIEIPFTSPDETVLIRATILNRNESVNVALEDGTTENHYIIASQLITTLSYVKEADKSNIDPEIYDLGTSLGMTYWKGRLVCWGVNNANNILFMSEPNEPEFFAYPNGIDTFEENIVYVTPYSDDLIVFTTTKIWRLTMSSDGLSWTKTLLQQNLRIIDEDVPYITVIKSLLFFKSDMQFYMIVPRSSGIVGELTIAPISKSIKDFLLDPFSNIEEIYSVVYPKLKEKHIKNYLVKYGTHIEQNRIFVDWWFDLTAFKNQSEILSENEIEHDYDPYNNDYITKEYLLFELVYDTQTYSWTMQTHITNSIGTFVVDAINNNTEYISLVLSKRTPYLNNTVKTEKDTWGISIASRQNTNDSLLETINFGNITTILNKPFTFNTALTPTYPRIQIFDTGYKEVTTPGLKKHFREIQLAFEPKSYKDEPTVGLRAIMAAQIDGHTVMTSVSKEITEELQEDGTLLIKVVDQINYGDIALIEEGAEVNYVPLPYTVDAELNNTFVLDSAAFTGVKMVKVRRAINGKGYLVRLRFTNTTEANYAIINHAFVSHNGNAR